MNGNPRHTHHHMNHHSHHAHHKHQPRPSQRRRRSRRQQVAVILWVVGITLLVLLTVFLIIGARMHKKSAALRAEQTQTEEPVTPPETPKTKSVLAYPLDRNTPSDSLKALKQQGISAASLALNEKNGAPLYSAATLGTIADTAKAQGVYLSGVYWLSSLSEKDDLARYRALSEDCATIAEAFEAGLDEVMLIPPTLSERDRVELLAMLEDLRRIHPDCAVGLALPQDFIPDDHAEPIDALAERFSLLAVNLSDSKNIDADVEADLYALLRYSMRVLLPASDKSQDAMLDAVHSHGITNIQILP